MANDGVPEVEAQTRPRDFDVHPRAAEFVTERSRSPRLAVHEGSAAEIVQALAANRLPAADAIVSGIPFSTMPRELGLAILRSVHEALVPGGIFVAYQVRDRVEDLGRSVFGSPQWMRTVVLNVPPMRIYRWRKAERGI